MFYRSAWGMLALMVIVAIGCIFIPKQYEHRALIQEKAELERKIAAEIEVRKDLQRKQERFQYDKRFIEYVAHQNGMVKPGEHLFIFDAEPILTPSSTEALN